MVRLVVVVLIGLTSLAPQSASAQTTPTHTVQSGETLFSISRRYGVALDEIRSINGIVNNQIHIGQILTLPAGAVDATAATTTTRLDPQDSSTTDLPVAQRVVKKGETLISIAAKLGMRVDSLAAINGWPVGYLEVDSTIEIPRSLAMREHVVEPRETLFLIARTYGSSVGELQRVNSLDGDLIKIGQVLRVPSADAPGPPPGAEPVVEEGRILIYPARFAGRLMASGERYDPTRYTVSHCSLPFGTVVLVEATSGSGLSFAEVADRTPVGADYLMEMSEAVSRAIKLETSEEPLVRLRVVH